MCYKEKTRYNSRCQTTYRECRVGLSSSKSKMHLKIANNENTKRITRRQRKKGRKYNKIPQSENKYKNRKRIAETRQKDKND